MAADRERVMLSVSLFDRSSMAPRVEVALPGLFDEPDRGRLVLADRTSSEADEGARAMPTAAEFEVMARQLDDARTTALAVGFEVSTDADPTIMQGAELSGLVEQAVEEVRGTTVAASIACGALADLCRHRALICRRYTDEFAAFERRSHSFVEQVRQLGPTGLVGSAPLPPQRPAAWVERG